MRISSILINGAEFRSLTTVARTSIRDDIGERIGIFLCRIQARPVDVDGDLFAAAAVEVWSIVEPETEPVPFDSVPFDLATFDYAGDEGEARLLFAGTIARIEPEAIGKIETAGTGITEYLVTCRSYAALLDSTLISSAEAYSSAADSAIIADLFTKYPPGLTGVNVSTVAVIDSIAFENISLRQAIEQIMDLSGAESWVDGYRDLHYRSPEAEASPWELSEEPVSPTSYAPLRGTVKFSTDFSTPANRVRVLGAVTGQTTQIAATVNDTGSQTTYGILSRTIVDRNIQTVEEATARGNVELARYANPIQSGSFETFTDGLAVGQLLTIDIPSLGIDGDYLIRRCEMEWLTQTLTRYRIEFGEYRPDLVRALRKLSQYAGQKPYIPVAVPPSQSLTPSHFASTIEPVRVVASLPSLPDPAYSANAVVLLTTDRKLYRRNGNTWTAAVPTVDLSGTITNTQIADSSISTPKLQALCVTAEILAANSVVAGKAAIDSITAGCIAAGAIRAEDAVFATAAIQSADIDNLNVGGGGGKPGKFAVYNASGVQIGFIGVEDGYSGAWFKQLGIGGTSKAAPKITADANGNVSINGATFLLSNTVLKTAIDLGSTGFGTLGWRTERVESPSTYRNRQVIATDAGFYICGLSAGSNPSENVLIQMQASAVAGSLNLGQIDIYARTPNSPYTTVLGYSSLKYDRVEIGGNQVLAARQSAVANPTVAPPSGSGSAVAIAFAGDAYNCVNELYNKLISVQGVLRAHGLMAT